MIDLEQDGLRAAPALAPTETVDASETASRSRLRSAITWIMRVPTGLLCLVNALSLLTGQIGYAIEISHISWLFALLYFVVFTIGLIPLLGPALIGGAGYILVISHADEATSTVRMIWRYFYGTVLVLLASNVAAFLAGGTMEFWIHVLR